MTASAAADNDDDDELKEESVCFDSGYYLFPWQRGPGPALEESLVPKMYEDFQALGRSPTSRVTAMGVCTDCSNSRSWVSS